MSSKIAMGLSLKHVFGFRHDIRRNMQYLHDESNLVYISGHNLVIYNTENQSQEFIPMTDPAAVLATTATAASGGGGPGAQAQSQTSKRAITSARSHVTDATGGGSGGTAPQASSRATTVTSDGFGVTAMSVSPLGRLVAVAEMGSPPTISIFDTRTKKRKKVLSLPVSSEHTAHRYVSVGFSADGKTLLALSGAPDYNLSAWMWDKGRMMQSGRATQEQRATLREASICPVDPSLVVVIGDSFLTFFRIEQTEIKRLPLSSGKRDRPQDFLCHEWAERGRLLVGTSNGEVLVFDQIEHRGTVEGFTADNRAVCSIAMIEKGFLCGCDNGVLHIFDRVDEKSLYKKHTSLPVKSHAARVEHLVVNSTSETAICCLGDSQVLSLALAQLDALKEDETQFEHFTHAVHDGSIIGMDLCIRKPLLATCGSDRSIRIYNYVDKSLVLQKTFENEPRCVAMHVQGLQLLVGFTDRLRLMNILAHDIRAFREFPIKNCREARFSNGGQYFAAVNGSTIQVFNTWTYENIGNLRGHTGLVRSIAWTLCDTGLVSAGMDSTVIQWRLKDGSKEQELQQKGCVFTSAVPTTERTVYAVGSDAALRELSSSKVSKQVALDLVVTQVVLTRGGVTGVPQRSIFAGTNMGVVRTFALPVTGSFETYQAHSSAITCMRMSRDDSLLFTASEDGTICMFNVHERDPAQNKKKKDAQASLAWAEEVLITKADVKKTRATITELETKVRELKLANDYEIKVKEKEYARQLSELHDKYQMELDEEIRRLSELNDEKADLEGRYRQRLDELNEKHENSITDLEQYHKHKLDTEKARYNELEKKLELSRERWSESSAKQEADIEQQIATLKAEYEAKTAAEVAACERIAAETEKIAKDFEETKVLIEEDADMEIDEIKADFDRKIRNETEMMLGLKGENGVVTRRYNALKEEIQKSKNVIRRSLEEEVKLFEQIKRLEKDIHSFKTEISERDATIRDKENRVTDLRKKNQELEKFKFVLDYKIKELNLEIAPREQDIRNLTKLLGEMNTEHSQYEKANTDLKLEQRNMNLKLAGMGNEIETQKRKNANVERFIAAYQAELCALKPLFDRPKELKRAFVKLYQKYALADEDINDIAMAGISDEGAASSANAENEDRNKSGGGRKEAGSKVDFHKDHQRHRSYLERSVDSLQRKVVKETESHKKEQQKIDRERKVLEKEITDLTRDIAFSEKCLEQAKISGVSTSQIGFQKSKRGRAKTSNDRSNPKRADAKPSTSSKDASDDARNNTQKDSHKSQLMRDYEAQIAKNNEIIQQLKQHVREMEEDDGNAF